jgi:hypothetical protein
MMATEMGKNQDWEDLQVENFMQTAHGYLP